MFVDECRPAKQTFALSVQAPSCRSLPRLGNKANVQLRIATADIEASESGCW